MNTLEFVSARLALKWVALKDAHWMCPLYTMLLEKCKINGFFIKKNIQKPTDHRLKTFVQWARRQPPKSMHTHTQSPHISTYLHIYIAKNISTRKKNHLQSIWFILLFSFKYSDQRRYPLTVLTLNDPWLQ